MAGDRASRKAVRSHTFPLTVEDLIELMDVGRPRTFGQTINERVKINFLGTIVPHTESRQNWGGGRTRTVVVSRTEEKIEKDKRQSKPVAKGSWRQKSERRFFRPLSSFLLLIRGNSCPLLNRVGKG